MSVASHAGAPWRCLAVAGVVAACAGIRPARAAVYGTDTRHHVYLEEDPVWRALGERSIVAKLRTGWGVCDGSVVVPTETLTEHSELCAGEAFADDLVLASCSATLVDDDLIVIARHCVLEEDACATSLFAPGLLLTGPDALAIPGPDDIYGCRQIVAEVPGIDIAFVQLDRPVAGDYVPATLGPAPTEAGAEVGVLGYPSGTPMKVARECTARSFNGSLVSHDCDTFRGNSGSGVFNGDGTLFGVHVNGPGDYDAMGDCYVTKVFTQDGQIPGIPSAPQFGAAARIADVLPALCDSGWPTPLCGSEASCGDGVCSGTETFANCNADCVAPQCGDAVCEPTAEVDCDVDCSHLTEVCDGGGTGSTGGSDSSGDGAGDTAGDDATGADDTTGGSDGQASTTGPEATTAGDGDSDGTGSGASATDGSDGGCGCRAQPEPSFAWLWLLLLAPLRRRGARLRVD